MNLDELLTRSARDLADDLLPIPPDPVLLGRQALAGQRRRRVTSLVVAAAAVAAVAVTVPTMVGRSAGGGPAETPSPSPTIGVRWPDAPSWVNELDELHVGEYVLEEPNYWGSSGQYALTATGAVRTGDLRSTGPGDRGLYWQPIEGTAYALLAEPWQLFTADPLGDHVVWVTRDSVLVTYDVVDRRVVDSRHVPGMRDSEGWAMNMPVLFVSEDRVVYEADGGVWSLDLTTKVVERLPGLSEDDVLDIGPDVAAVATSELLDPKSEAKSLTQIEFRRPGGTVLAERGRLFREGHLSPDGRWFITSTGYEAGLRAVLLDTTTGQEVPLALPDWMRGAYGDPWGWSSPDVLMIDMIPPNGDDDGPKNSQLWTCRPSTGSCEAIEDALPVFPR